MTETVLYALLKQKLQEAVESLGQPLKFGGVVADDAAVFALANIDKGTIYITEEGKEWIAKEDITTADQTKWEQFGELGVTKPVYFGDNTIINNKLLTTDGTNGQIKSVANPLVGQSFSRASSEFIPANLLFRIDYEYQDEMSYWKSDTLLEEGTLCFGYNPQMSKKLYLKIGARDSIGHSPLFSDAPEFSLSPDDAPCLIEGTLITMADGTNKPVEQVKKGDLVKSYNPLTKEITSAVVLSAVKTGTANNFMTYSFEDGKFITAYGIEGIYENKLGAIKDIQKATKKDEFITEDLTYTYFYLKKPYFHHGTPKNRYSLIISNNLYFANGILLGHSPYKKYWGITQNLVNVPDEIKNNYKLECDKYNQYSDFINTSEYQEEIAEAYSNLAKANETIRTYKEKLSASDYKVQKYTEGLLTEEEWNESKARRAEWRKIVNDNQELQAAAKITVREIINKYRQGITPRQLFEESFEEDNAVFITLRNYYQNK